MRQIILGTCTCVHIFVTHAEAAKQISCTSKNFKISVLFTFVYLMLWIWYSAYRSHDSLEFPGAQSGYICTLYGRLGIVFGNILGNIEKS